MRRSHAKIFLPAMLLCLLYSAGTVAQSAHPEENSTLTRAEALAFALKQGMTLEEVEKLLGKPIRTALRTPSPCEIPDSSQDTLQWTYVWPDPSQAEHDLEVVFVKKSPGQWLVNNWDWTGI